jgi:hypothetical protein
LGITIIIIIIIIITIIIRHKLGLDRPISATFSKVFQVVFVHLV